MIGLAAWFALGAAQAAPAPEISRSRGAKDGVTVLWPRVVPATDDPAVAAAAGGIQARVAERAAQMLGAELVAVRPAPERVCPREGCKGASVTLLLGQDAGGCVVVAAVGKAGPTPQALVPLAGDVALSGSEIPFRGAPEAHVVVREFVRCADVVAELDLEALGRALAEARAAE